MATSATRAPALPAPRLQPGSSARSQKFPSAPPPFFPTHDGKDARPIETRLLVLAWQFELRVCHTLANHKGNTRMLKTIFDERRPVLCARAILRYTCKPIPWLNSRNSLSRSNSNLGMTAFFQIATCLCWSIGGSFPRGGGMTLFCLDTLFLRTVGEMLCDTGSTL